MSHLDPLSRQALAEFEPVFQIVEAAMGFVPNSMLTMGRRPDLLRAFGGLSTAVLGPGKIDSELKSLVSYVSSNAAGCNYCRAHTAHTAHNRGASPEKIEAAFEYDTNPMFTDAERAALRLANDGALVPNAVTGAHFTELKKHFDEDEIVELVSVVSLFGFLNRWNDTLATELEAGPRAFAEKTLGTDRWNLGKHG